MKKHASIQFVCTTLALFVFLANNCLPIFALDDYYYSENERYYFGNNDFYLSADYAETYVSEYGEYNEGFPIPTDFEAITYGETLGLIYGSCKIVYVKVCFYEPDQITNSYGTDTVAIPGNIPDDPDSDSAIVYGADYVNEEYGLATFSSEHWTECAYINDFSGEYEIWLTSQTIHIDTTGFMR